MKKASVVFLIIIAIIFFVYFFSFQILLMSIFAFVLGYNYREAIDARIRFKRKTESVEEQEENKRINKAWMEYEKNQKNKNPN